MPFCLACARSKQALFDYIFQTCTERTCTGMNKADPPPNMFIITVFTFSVNIRHRLGSTPEIVTEIDLFIPQNS